MKDLARLKPLPFKTVEGFALPQKEKTPAPPFPVAAQRICRKPESRF
jgi:hypothetical protein